MEQEKRGYLYLLSTFFLWGSLYVVSKYVLGVLPTFTVSFGRYLITYLVLTVLSARRPKTEIAREDWKYIFIIGFLGYFVSIGMQLFGTKYAGPSMASLINSMCPIAISIMAALILKERLTVPKVGGILLSLFGVYLIIGTGADVNILGVVFSLIALIGWSFVSVVTRKVTGRYDPLTITRAAAGVTVICDLPVCILELCTASQPVRPDAAALLGLLYMGVFCTTMTMTLWNKCLSMFPASFCSAFYPIQTLTSSILGILIFHEKAGLSFAAGSAFIIVGVLVSVLIKGGGRKRGE